MIPVPDIRARFLKLFTAAVNDVMRFEHKRQCSLPSDYLPLRGTDRMCGRAFTIKGGPDLTTDGEFENRAQMLEDLPEDSLVVWDCTGDTVTAQWGEMMTMAAAQRGCRGAIVNGVRDVDRVLPQDFPVFHRYTCSTGMLGRFRMFHYQKPVLMGEVVVEPGDWIFADGDGIVAIPAAIAEAVLISAEKILSKEKDIKEMVQSGMRPTEIVRNGGYF